MAVKTSRLPAVMAISQHHEVWEISLCCFFFLFFECVAIVTLKASTFINELIAILIKEMMALKLVRRLDKLA